MTCFTPKAFPALAPHGKRMSLLHGGGTARFSFNSPVGCEWRLRGCGGPCRRNGLRGWGVDQAWLSSRRSERSQSAFLAHQHSVLWAAFCGECPSALQIVLLRTSRAKGEVAHRTTGHAARKRCSPRAGVLARTSGERPYSERSLSCATKKHPQGCLFVAQRRGFEPPDDSPPSRDFQSRSLSLSDISACLSSYWMGSFSILHESAQKSNRFPLFFSFFVKIFFSGRAGLGKAGEKLLARLTNRTRADKIFFKEKS